MLFQAVETNQSNALFALRDICAQRYQRRGRMAYSVFGQQVSCLGLGQQSCEFRCIITINPSAFMTETSLGLFRARVKRNVAV